MLGKLSNGLTSSNARFLTIEYALTPDSCVFNIIYVNVFELSKTCHPQEWLECLVC